MAKNTRTKSWDELTFADNYLFCRILETEPELCRQLLELLLHIKIDHLEPPQIERTVRDSFDSKSVRFDVYTADEGRVFDLEMQTTDTKNLPKRARYYQSSIDRDILEKGENYTKLKDSYVIFLCLDDIFGKGLPVYFFENLCQQNKELKLNDGTFKVFFNTKNCDKIKSVEEKDFFRFLNGSKAETSFSKKIEEKVKFAKKNSEWRRDYMTWQQTIDEEKQIAFEDGAQAKARESARNLLHMNLLTPKQIAQAVSLPLEEVLAIKNTGISKNSPMAIF